MSASLTANGCAQSGLQPPVLHIKCFLPSPRLHIKVQAIITLYNLILEILLINRVVGSLNNYFYIV